MAGRTERNYAYLTNSNEAANRLASDIMRLAPKPSQVGINPLEEPDTSGIYLVDNGDKEFVVRPFVDDAYEAEFPERRPRARFYLGIVIDPLWAWADAANNPYTRMTGAEETVGVEGGDLDVKVLDWSGASLRALPKGKFPLRVRATMGEQDVFDTTDLTTTPLFASNAFLKAFYERYHIVDLDRRVSMTPSQLQTIAKNSGGGPIMSEEQIAMQTEMWVEEGYRHSDADAPDPEPEPEFDPDSPRFDSRWSAGYPRE